jgi:hypothetical protein
MGRKIGYTCIEKIAYAMENPRGFWASGLRNEFFLAKFSNHNHNDHDFALFERP